MSMDECQFHRSTVLIRILFCLSWLCGIIVSIVSVASTMALAQAPVVSSTLDSLQQELQRSAVRPDTSNARLLNALAREYFARNPERALGFARRALELAERITDNAESQSWKAQALSNIGVAYFYQGKYDKALEYHLQALTLRERLGDKRGQAASLNNIGLVYYDESKYDLALVHHLKALKLREEIGDQQGVSSSLSNIGLIYSEQLQYDSAQAYFLKALSVFRQIGDKQGEASLLNNIGRIYTNQGNYDNALECYRQSLELKRQLGNHEGEAASLNNIAQVWLERGQYRAALRYSEQALELADSVGAIVRKQEALETISDIYTALGDDKRALEYYRQYVAVRNEILNRESQNKTLQLQAQYETEKKDQEIKLLNAEREAQNQLRNGLIGGGLLLLALLGLAVNRYRDKKRANEEILQQKRLVEEQAASIKRANDELAERNRELDEKNHEIMDSIFYAERIQRAVLPDVVAASGLAVEQFILFRPRDIVSGDFYWSHSLETAEHGVVSIIAAVDCTGHGVPGAFMSMIGNTILNQIVVERKITNPALILEELNVAVRRALKQDQEDEEDERGSRDGMDVCLCSIEPQAGRVVFAGAKRPLYVVRPSLGGAPCEEIKGDRASIGGKQKEERRTFTNHEVLITQPITLYLTTDGFADQPNPSMEKFGSRRLRELFSDMAIFPAMRQRQMLLNELKQFQGSAPQRDDITIVGVKLRPPKNIEKKPTEQETFVADLLRGYG